MVTSRAQQHRRRMSRNSNTSNTIVDDDSNGILINNSNADHGSAYDHIDNETLNTLGHNNNNHQQQIVSPLQDSSNNSIESNNSGNANSINNNNASTSTGGINGVNRLDALRKNLFSSEMNNSTSAASIMSTGEGQSDCFFLFFFHTGTGFSVNNVLIV